MQLGGDALDLPYLEAIEKNNNEKNIRDMLAAGVKLERIESILGETNNVRDLAK